jgi:hypothetical protein
MIYIICIYCLTCCITDTYIWSACYSVDQGIISTEWISTNDQQADILTKQLTATKFTQFRNLLMVG